jgi:hypothetical protein
LQETTLWKGRDFRERNATRVVAGRSFAEVVGRPKSSENMKKVLPAEMVEGPISVKSDGGRGQLHTQTRTKIIPTKVDELIGTSKVLAEAGGCFCGAPAKFQAQASEKGMVGSIHTTTSALPNALQNPVKLGVAAPKGGCESEGDGQASGFECVDLKEIANCLTDIRSQLELGLKRVDWAFQVLEQKECRGSVVMEGKMGLGEKSSRATQNMGREEVGWSKPNKKNFKRKTKLRSTPNQPGLLGPKPDKMPAQVDQCSGSTKLISVPHPSIVPAQGPQCSGSTKLAKIRMLSRNPVQEVRQAGETSEMGCARDTGVNGSMLAGVISGEQHAGAGALNTTILGSTEKADMAGEHIAGTGRPEELMTTKSVSSSEDAEGLGCEFSSPVLLLSTIPESDELGNSLLSPAKCSKRVSESSEFAERVSESSEFADEVGLDCYTPGKQTKQMKVLQRRESPTAKITKSWVAERVSWNGGKGSDASAEVVSGKNLNSCLGKNLNFSSDLEEQTDGEGADLGNKEELGCLVGI